jgi:hypothetical protein
MEKVPQRKVYVVRDGEAKEVSRRTQKSDKIADDVKAERLKHVLDDLRRRVRTIEEKLQEASSLITE